MGILTCQVRIPHENNLPADTVVNTFAFFSEIDRDSAASTIASRLLNFYNTETATQSIAKYLSPELQTQNSRLVITDLLDPQPRVPYYDEPLALTMVPTSNTALPAEVALVCSFQGDVASGQNQARRRGRIFLGPLGFTAGTANVGTKNVPSSSFIARILASAEAMATASTTDVRWVVYSRVDGGATRVTNGWCDNAWDTQRRRGTLPSSRNVWSV